MDFLHQRIVCLTEETTELLYLLGQQHRIVGISGFTVRPRLCCTNYGLGISCPYPIMG